MRLLDVLLKNAPNVGQIAQTREAWVCPSSGQLHQSGDGQGVALLEVDGRV